MALTIVLFLYFIATALVAQSRFNLRLAAESSERVQQKYASKALVAEAIADLNLSNISLATLEERGQGEGRAWVEQDPTISEFYHVRARVGEQTYSRVIRSSPTSLPLLFQTDTAGQISVFNGTDWEDLPATPQFVWEDPDGDGDLTLATGEHTDFDAAIHFQAAYANNEGTLFLVYQPADPNNLGGPPIIMSAVREEANNWTWGTLATLPEPQTYMSLAASQDHFFLLRDDGVTVESLFDGNLTVYPQTPEPLLRLQGNFVSLESSDGTPRPGNVYAETGNDVYTFDNGSWDQVSIPDTCQTLTYNEQIGDFQWVDVPYTRVHVGAGQEGRLSVYGIVDAGPGNLAIVEYIDSDGDDAGWGRRLPFGNNYLVENPDGTTQLNYTDANVEDFDVDGAGNPFVEFTQGGETHLFHTVAGYIQHEEFLGSALAAGGTQPQVGDQGTGGQYSPLSHY